MTLPRIFSRSELRKEGNVFVLTMTAGENRFHPEMMDELEQHFDFIEEYPDAASLVITGQGKFFSNGLDTSFFTAETFEGYLSRYQKLLARLLTLNLPTIAAINGHAFAGGCMFAFACDFRFMRTDRGFLCLPEVDLGFDLSPGMSALIRERIMSANGIRDMILMGKRLTAKEGMEAGIVDRMESMDHLLVESIAFAEKISPKAAKREAFGRLKAGTYFHVHQVLHGPVIRSNL